MDEVSKRYGHGPASSMALRDVNLSIERGEFVSITGPSGCGKSTLLNLIAGLDHPTSGQVIVGGRNLARLSERERSTVRLNYLGFIFQSFNLLPRLTVADNVGWRLRKLGVSSQETHERTASILEQVGVSAPAWSRYPSELSGGEQQRVAAARALVTEPELLLADEPTGNLDSATGKVILDLLSEMNSSRGRSVVLVTHDTFAATYGNRTITLRDGLMESEVSARKRATKAADVLKFDRRQTPRQS